MKNYPTARLVSFTLLLLCVGLVSPGFAGLFALSTNYSVGSNPSSVCLANLRGNHLFRDMVVANFNDSSVSVRLCLDDGTFGHMDTYTVGKSPTSVKFADFNNNGNDDLVTANSGTNTVSVLMNLGVGANFRAATNYVVGTNSNPSPRDVAVGDINRDGRADLVVANFSENSVSVLTNQSGGVFGGLVNYPVGEGPSSICVTDLNGDNRLDIVTANKTDGTVSILFGQSDGSFSAAQNITLFPG